MRTDALVLRAQEHPRWRFVILFAVALLLLTLAPSNLNSNVTHLIQLVPDIAHAQGAYTDTRLARAAAWAVQQADNPAVKYNWGPHIRRDTWLPGQTKPDPTTYCERFIENAFGTDHQYDTATFDPNDLDYQNLPENAGQSDPQKWVPWPGDTSSAWSAFQDAGLDLGGGLTPGPVQPGLIQPGVIVLFKANAVSNWSGHAGIYIGDDEMVSVGPDGVTRSKVAEWTYATLIGYFAPPETWKSGVVTGNAIGVGGGGPALGGESAVNFTEFDFEPTSDAASVGDAVSVHLRAEPASQVGAVRMQVDGNVGSEFAGPEANLAWQTGGLPAGDHVVRVEARLLSANGSWDNAAWAEATFNLQPSACTAPDGWATGNLVGLQRGAEIWEGPGRQGAMTPLDPSVLEPYTVRVIGGPQCVGTDMWMDISRPAAGDPSGGTGWVIPSQAGYVGSPGAFNNGVFLSVDNSSASIGTAVTVHATATDVSYNTIRVTTPCGSPAQYETGAPSVTFTWSTDGCSNPGQVTLTGEARRPDDPSWSNALSGSIPFTLTPDERPPAETTRPDIPTLIRCGPGFTFSSCYANGEYGDGPNDAAWQGADGSLDTQWSSLEHEHSYWQATFQQPVTVAEVTIWGRGGGDTLSGQLQFSDGSSVDTGGLNGDGCAHTVSFSPRTTTFLRFQVTGMGNRNTTGFRDIEAYQSAPYTDGDSCGRTPTSNVYATPLPEPTCDPGGTRVDGLKSAFLYPAAHPESGVSDVRMLTPDTPFYAPGGAKSAASQVFSSDQPVRFAFTVRPRRAGITYVARYTRPDGRVGEIPPMSAPESWVGGSTGVAIARLTAVEFGWDDLPVGFYKSEVLVEGTVVACVQWSMK